MTDNKSTRHNDRNAEKLETGEAEARIDDVELEIDEGSGEEVVGGKGTAIPRL
jgi:hypothetical protein